MATKGIGLREWSLKRSDYDSDAAFREAVQMELASFEHIGERLGICVTASPARRKENGRWITLGWVFATGTTPAVPSDGPAEEPETELHRELHDGALSAIEPEDALVEDPDSLATVE